MSDALCTKYGCDYQLDLDGQVTCSNCGAMDDDMLPRRTYADMTTPSVIEQYDGNNLYTNNVVRY